jgi:glycine cleavage system H protein
MNTPEELKYTESHEWIRVDGEDATIGITDHAQNELSDVVFVELPEQGKAVSAKDPVAVVESVKAASDIYSPVSGTITAVNSQLSDEPALINTSPYEQGWIYKIKLTDPGELGKLKDASAYEKQLRS